MSTACLGRISAALNRGAILLERLGKGLRDISRIEIVSVPDRGVVGNFRFVDGFFQGAAARFSQS
jgi:hypothetical protein